ncbi:MauE/DoxX family redox-associated membrane protein [Streptomyces sp. GC420]|uniref:MauE/DoxX family redox-associated membrane protein n=1 Tax=Streptomyces sp. GC420 TaxID=2697568 RepID=UPI001414F57C|nr:MauE/DoxX family redox-associated membrane protein [Streptomyces sp. GC420]NBM14644.1 methylamine utilization protein MauE [Streptomyces sp. GC420]
MDTTDVVEWASRGCLLWVFVLSARGKTRGRHAFGEFTEAVRAYAPILVGRGRSSAAPVVAALVVAAEVTVATILLLPGAAPAGLALAAVLLAAFALVAAAALRTPRGAPCRCFGRTSAPLGPVHLVRNLVLLAVAGAGLTATALAGPGHPAPVPAAVAFAAGSVIGLLAVALDDLVALFRPLDRREHLV